VITDYLKGFIGDEINLLLAATAFNLKKWMNHFFAMIFMVKIALLLHTMVQIKPKERRKYTDLYLMIYKLW